MNRDSVGIQIRYDTGIPEMLETIAEHSGESVNKLIVTAVAEKLRKDGYLTENSMPEK